MHAQQTVRWVGYGLDGVTLGSDIANDCSEIATPCATVAYAVTQSFDNDIGNYKPKTSRGTLVCFFFLFYFFSLFFFLSYLSSQKHAAVVVRSGQYAFPGADWLPESFGTLSQITITGEARGLWGFFFVLTVCSFIILRTQGQTIFDGGGGVKPGRLLDWSSGFTTGSGCRVTIAKFVFRNVRLSDSLIRISGNNHESLKFSECSFSDVTAQSTNGGSVIRVLGNTKISLSVSDCVFERCKSGSSADGGAILWGPVGLAAALVVDSPSGLSAFTGCSGKSGGAIALRSEWGVQVSIFDTTFTGCAALESGGAISTLSPTVGSPSNSALLFGCSFVDNQQGTVGAATVSDGRNFGGGAIAATQGRMLVRGASPGHRCVFSGNFLSKSPAAVSVFGTALLQGGGSAVLASATAGDGDGALTGLELTSCEMIDNKGQVINMVGSALYVASQAADTDVPLMSLKPSLSSMTFLNNDAVNGPSGLHYMVPSTVAPTLLGSGSVAGSVFSSAPPLYDISVSGGVVMGSAVSVGRLTIGANSTVFVGGTLLIQPPDATNAVFMGAGAILSNQGTLLMQENVQISASTSAAASLVSSGTLSIVKQTTVLPPVSLSLLQEASAPLTKFVVRSDSDAARLTVGSPVPLIGNIDVTLASSYAAVTPPVIITLLSSTALSGTFVANTCQGASGAAECSFVYTPTEVQMTVAKLCEGCLEVTPSPNGTGSGSRDGEPNIGAIVGGVVGGIALIAIVVMVVFFLIVRKRVENDPTLKPVDVSHNPAFGLDPEELSPVGEKSRV